MRREVIAQGKTAFVDFVVAGILIGAILVVAGTVVRDRGPRSRPRIVRSNDVEIAPETLIKAWRRFCVSAGTLITTLGMIIVLVTVAAMVFGVSDRAGAMAVAMAVALTAVLLAYAVLTMPNHYRRGGFDPVYRSRPVVVPGPAVVEHDLEIPLRAGAGQTIDDLFTIASQLEPVPETMASAPVVQLNVPDITAPGETVEDDRLAVEPDMAVDPEATIGSAEEFLQPETSAPPQVPNQRRLRPEESARRLTERLKGTTEQYQPTPAEPIAAEPYPELELTDPDDELPAWNAPPPPVRQRPTPRQPISTARPTGERQVASGFESSLLADLDLPDSDDSRSGPFQSKLLNKLTGDDTEPGEPRADMLLDEFSLPERDPQSRDADNSR